MDASELKKKIQLAEQRGTYVVGDAVKCSI